MKMKEQIAEELLLKEERIAYWEQHQKIPKYLAEVQKWKR